MYTYLLVCIEQRSFLKATVLGKFAQINSLLGNGETNKADGTSSVLLITC